MALQLRSANAQADGGKPAKRSDLGGSAVDATRYIYLVPVLCRRVVVPGQPGQHSLGDPIRLLRGKRMRGVLNPDRRDVAAELIAQPVLIGSWLERIESTEHFEHRRTSTGPIGGKRDALGRLMLHLQRFETTSNEPWAGIVARSKKCLLQRSEPLGFRLVKVSQDEGCFRDIEGNLRCLGRREYDPLTSSI